MNTKSLFFILTAPAILLAGCGKKDTAGTPVRVRLETAAAISGQASSYYSGVIEAFKDIPLSFQTGGTVGEVLVREGQSVEKGQLLATLDCRTNENSLRMAEAREKQAQDAWRRFEPMYKNGNLPEIKMVEIETARTQAEIALKQASKDSGDCKLSAPERGIISARSIEPGGTQPAAQAALKLVTVDQVYAAISVPESEISEIKAGSWAKVEIPALMPEAAPAKWELTRYRDTPGPAPRLQGVVTDSGITTEPLSRTYAVRVLLNNPGRRILPGMLCSVYTAGRNRADMTLLPATAINIDDGARPFVYIVTPGEKVARKRLVETAGFAKGGVVISAGIKAGETVVSEGAQKLSDGAAIEADENYGN